MENEYQEEEDSLASRILVVDDERRIRDACRIVLEEKGHDVALASDGDIGLKMIEAEHFDVVLLDLMMQAMSGFEVLERIHALHPDTMVIVITGYATVEHSIDAMKKGAFDFIPKPFSPKHLLAVVDKAIKYTRALQDIAESQSRLRVMVNRISNGVMATDSSKRAVLANPAFLHLIGYKGKPVIGQTANSFIQSDSLLELIDAALVMPADSSVEISGEIPFGDEEEKIFHVVCTPFRDRTGQNVGTITVLNDITALKKIDRMKSDFVSMVSHEIRSPMNSVMMQIRVILDGLAGDITEKQREILERASGKINSLVDMTSELLDLAKIESGLLTQEKELLDLESLADDQVRFHEASARDAGIQIELQPAAKMKPVLANRQNMDEVLTNLIGNAIKYSPDGGRITVSSDQEDGYAVIRVSDTGLGIPQEELNQIFSRFFRVKNGSTRMIHGTGLGLAIVKSIVEAHHGHIEVESAVGVGTTFSVYLPFA